MVDIHKKQWSVHLRTDICDHRGFLMPPDPEKLFQYMQLHFPDHEVAAAFEIGWCGFWPARHCLNYGWQATVVNPGDIKRSDKHRYLKTDAIDCRHICKVMKLQNLWGLRRGAGVSCAVILSKLPGLLRVAIRKCNIITANMLAKIQKLLSLKLHTK